MGEERGHRLTLPVVSFGASGVPADVGTFIEQARKEGEGTGWPAKAGRTRRRTGSQSPEGTNAFSLVDSGLRLLCDLKSESDAGLPERVDEAFIKAGLVQQRVDQLIDLRRSLELRVVWTIQGIIGDIPSPAPDEGLELPKFRRLSGIARGVGPEACCLSPGPSDPQTNATGVVGDYEWLRAVGFPELFEFVFS